MSQLTKIAPNAPSLSISSVKHWGGCKEQTEKHKLYRSFLWWKYAVIEKECIYILFVEPFEFEPNLSFIALKDIPSQDADGIKSAIMKAFDDIGMPELKDRMVLLASDGASVNSGIKTGLATKFCEDGIDWLVFVWCLSYQLELALKDSLDDILTPVKKSLTNLFYLYHKSSKKLRIM